MPFSSENFTLPKRCDTDDKMVDFNQDFSIPGESEPLRFRMSESGVIFHLSGTATAFEAVVERSTRDPVRDISNWAPAEEEAWIGSADAVSPRVYDEPARGWWRLRVLSVTGGNLQLNIIGERA